MFKQHISSRLRLPGLLLAAVLAFAGKAAHAVPSFNQLEPANNYGTVSASFVTHNASGWVYKFTVVNTQPAGGDGIKGVLVYSPAGSTPIDMSQPARAQAKLQQQGTLAWWDFNGSPDNNNDGIPDNFIEPGESITDNTFTLTYATQIDISKLNFGLHVATPGGFTFFAHAGRNATWTGKVTCASCSIMAGCGISGASVQVVRNSDNALIGAPIITDGNGNFTISPLPPDGAYVLKVSAPDYADGQSSLVNWANNGPDIFTPIGLSPLPINYDQILQFKGRVIFTDRATFAAAAAGNPILTSVADLMNPANVGKFFQYNGVIPSYPELGTFSSANPIYVFIEQALLPENNWDSTSASFRNLVYVQDGQGTDPNRSKDTPYTVRVLFSQPFTGPGTAVNYTITGLSISTSLSTPTWTRLPSVPTTGSGMTPPLDVVPPGWMAQTRFEFRQLLSTSFQMAGVGTFNDKCGGLFPFSIHPDVPGLIVP